MKFLFDLDGTITAEETLPIIARIGNCESQIRELTEQTVQGQVPFIESFIRRVYILRNIPVSSIYRRLQDVNLHKRIVSFIQDNKDQCAIATGNFSCWCDGLVKKIGCELYCSTAEVEEDTVVKINSILHKERVVLEYKSKGETVVFIGDGDNDAEAMRQADISIAVGLTRPPAPSLYSVCDYMVFSEDALCQLLNQLL
ncbi:MAG: HAD-IB family phosphatase [Bacteroidales bacterium]|nr:HAD-IB family phosphatase [Bacteroidales bacterium]